MHAVDIRSLKNYVKYHPRPRAMVISSIVEGPAFARDYILKTIEGISSLNTDNPAERKIAQLMLECAVNRMNYIGIAQYMVEVSSAAADEILNTAAEVENRRQAARVRRCFTCRLS